MNGLTRDDPHVIAFVVTCFYEQAISPRDIRQWALRIIDEFEEPPLYIFDLADFADMPTNIDPVIGFVSSANLNIKEEMALQAIAYKRGVELIDVAAKPETLLGWLEKCPHIEERFREIFPWIDF